MTTSPSITSGQESQITRFTEDAVRRVVRKILAEQAFTDKDGLQKLVVERGDEYQARLERDFAPIIETTLRDMTTSNKYANEEVRSTYVYPPTYRRRGITEQTNRLRELIPGAGFADEKLADDTKLMPGTEGYFAILRWQNIAKSYPEACQKLMDVAERVYGKKRFKNWLEGRLDAEHLRQGQRSIARFRVLGEQQQGYDILVVQAQLGLRHAGCSPRRADERFLGNEFGLGLFGNLCIILTHPERLSTGNELWMDCTGDEFSPDAVGRFERVPCLVFDGGFQLDSSWVGVAYDVFGSSSGFSPQ